MKMSFLKFRTLAVAFIRMFVGIKKVFKILFRGYKMYKSAIIKESIYEKIKNIKSKGNYITIDRINEEFKSQLLKSEDRRFYYHFGLDPIAVVRAIKNNIKARRFVQGGSTITQQLAKNMYFSFDKKLERKVAELFVAFQLERILTKDEILELYCNIVCYGQGCYGIKEASMHYYGVMPIELTKEQITALVFTIKCPDKYNPNVYQKDKVQKQLVIETSMQKLVA